MAKINHMQEFVDKFRASANRAALVQSRIKAIEREEVIRTCRCYIGCGSSGSYCAQLVCGVHDQIVEAVEEESDGFKFTFEDTGQLGRPIIQLEGVSFGYGAKAVSQLIYNCFSDDTSPP